MNDGHWNAGITIAAGVAFGVLLTATYATFVGGGIEAKDWLQFLGTLLGVGATIIAGGLAWAIGQKQIRYKEDTARAVVDAKLEDYLGIANVAWMAIDKATSTDNPLYIGTAEIFSAKLDDETALSLINEIETVAKEASATERSTIATITKIARIVASKVKNQQEIDAHDFPGRRVGLVHIRIYLTWLYETIEPYSRKMANTFDGRTKIEIYNRNDHEQYKKELEAFWANIETGLWAEAGPVTPEPNNDSGGL